MLPYKRSQRVAHLLKKEISVFLSEHVTDPRAGFFTVTDVALTDDLKHAKIFVSVLNEDKRAETIEILNAMRGMIRAEVLRSFSMKVIPQIEFHLDTSVEYGDKIERLLKKIKEEEG